MIRLVVSKPVFQKSGATSTLIGYEYRTEDMGPHNPIILDTDEKVMFAIPVSE